MEKTNKLSKRTRFFCKTLHTHRRIQYVPPLKVSVVRVLLINVRGAEQWPPPFFQIRGRGGRAPPPPPCNDAYVHDTSFYLKENIWNINDRLSPPAPVTHSQLTMILHSQHTNILHCFVYKYFNDRFEYIFRKNIRIRRGINHTPQRELLTGSQKMFQVNRFVGPIKSNVSQGVS